MFNEKSGMWIKIYKIIAIVLFFAIATFGFIAGIGDASAGILDIGMGGDDDGFLDFFVWTVLGGFVGFGQLVFNMLVIQLLNNVQTIRIKLEGENDAPAEVETPAEQSVAVYACPKCGAAVAAGATVCGACGQTFNWNQK